MMDKNIKFESSLSKSEIKTKLKQSIKRRNKPTDFIFIFFLPNEIQGNVSDDLFWLQHTRPHSRNFPQRYFEGSIEQQGDVSVIKGRFKYTPFPKIVSIIFMTILLIISLVRYFINIQYPFLPLLLAFIPMMSFFISPVYFSKDEEIVISFLKSILNV